VISDAGLARLEKASRTPIGNEETIQVSSGDVAAACREIRRLRSKADKYDELLQGVGSFVEILREVL
jgi:hypothetical protein